MSRRKSRQKSWKLPLSIEMLQNLALKIIDGEDVRLISAEHRLCGSSGVWRTASGRLTMRFAFRTNAGNSVVYTMRNVPDPRTVEWAD